MEKYKEELPSFTYDVFLSFRGEDTRNIFIGHLHEHLLQKGIKTFIDDENLKIGEGIFPAISKAIQESKISIIVFSKSYASSTWCLDELDEIIKCMTRNDNSSNNDNKQLAFPIFYHVDPSDVRHQRNSYNEAMTAHVNRFGENSEKVQAWRSALHEAANLKGHHISTGCENIHIKKIVEEVYANIAPNDQVGLEHRILDMKPCVKKIVQQLEAASFLVNVREESSEKINGQEDLQKSTLPLEMLEVSEIQLGSESIGRIQDMLQRSLEIYTKTDLKLSVVQKRISKRLATAKDELSWKYQWHL